MKLIHSEELRLLTHDRESLEHRIICLETIKAGQASHETSVSNMLKNRLFKTHYQLYSNRNDKAKIISYVDGKAEEVLHRLVMFKQKVSDRRVAIMNKGDEVDKEIRVSVF